MEEDDEISCWDTWAKLLVFIDECEYEMRLLHTDPTASKEHRTQSIDRVARLYTTLEKVERHLTADPDHASHR